MMNLFRPAKVLDDSGFVIVLGDVVFLKPEQRMKLRLNLVLWQRLIDDIL
ncbi:hypothetical protein Hanom_Chr00s023551g01762761 [Helianthus anomalus]